MNALNAFLARMTALVLEPLAEWPRTALILIATAAGVLAAVAFRYTSNQKALRRVADRGRANLLTMRLFGDNVGVVLSAQRGLFTASILRLLHSLPPMIVLIVPFVILLAHLAMWYEFRPLRPGEKTLVELRVSPQAWAAMQNVPIEPPAGIKLDAGPVRDHLNHTLTWRMRAEQPLDGVLRWALPDGGQVEKRIRVSDADRLTFVNPIRAGTSWSQRLLYPGEPAFDAAAVVQGVSIEYPARVTRIFGWNVPWWLTFFVASIVAALLLKPWLRVQF